MERGMGMSPPHWCCLPIQNPWDLTLPRSSDGLERKKKQQQGKRGLLGKSHTLGLWPKLEDTRDWYCCVIPGASSRKLIRLGHVACRGGDGHCCTGVPQSSARTFPSRLPPQRGVASVAWTLRL